MKKSIYILKSNIIYLILFLPVLSVSQIVETNSKYFGSNNTKVITDNFGNIYLAGSFNGILSSQIGKIDYTVFEKSDSYDIYILKISQFHEIIWSYSFEGINSDLLRDLLIDSQGNIILIGSLNGSLDLDPSEKYYPLTSSDNMNFFVCKLSSEGKFISGKRYGLNGYIPLKHCIDHENSIYLAGEFKNELTIKDSLTENIIKSKGEEDVYIAKIDSTGLISWIKQIGGEGIDQFMDMDVDNKYNLYLLGTYDFEVDLDPSDREYFSSPEIGFKNLYLLKLDKDINLKYVFLVKGYEYYNTRPRDEAYIKVDSDGIIYLASNFNRSLKININNVEQKLISKGSFDFYFCKIDESGNAIWLKQVGGKLEDKISGFELNALGSIYSTGAFTGICDFDPSDSTYEIHSRNGEFDTDGFILLLASNGNFGWVTQYNHFKSHVLIQNNGYLLILSNKLYPQTNKDLISTLDEINPFYSIEGKNGFGANYKMYLSDNRKKYIFDLGQKYDVCYNRIRKGSNKVIDERCSIKISWFSISKKKVDSSAVIFIYTKDINVKIDLRQVRVGKMI